MDLFLFFWPAPVQFLVELGLSTHKKHRSGLSRSRWWHAQHQRVGSYGGGELEGLTGNQKDAQGARAAIAIFVYSRHHGRP